VLGGAATRRDRPTHYRLEVGGRAARAMCEQPPGPPTDTLGRKSGIVNRAEPAEVKHLLRSILAR
jgi:hypothetical protein